jgi:pSer/pThr/pTyr-binding forkhead associated (FHA) protein
MGISLALINRNPDLPFADFKLDPGTFTVGRSSACDFALCDATISRRHARLMVSDSQILVTDLNSRNGTFIQGEAVTTGCVRPGQELRFGRVKFILVNLEKYLPTEDSDLQTAEFREGRPGPVIPSPVRSVLTRAQMKVLGCLLEGMIEKEVGVKLGISHHTVHNHVREIYSHLNVRSRGELMAKFIPSNLDPRTDPPSTQNPLLQPEQRPQQKAPGFA